MNQSTQHKPQRPSGVARRIFATAALSILISGCQSSQKQTQSTPATSAPLAERTGAETPSRLSYGTITTTVKKGVTTQSDLVAMFGGPNIATLDSDGTETWVYEKTASETTTTSQQTVTAQAERLDVFFGLGLLRKGAVVSQSNAGGTVTHSVKTLTVIIKFNQDNKTVKEFSARASYF